MINIVNIVYVPSLIQQKVLFPNLSANVLHRDIVAKTEFLTYFLCSTFVIDSDDALSSPKNQASHIKSK